MCELTMKILDFVMCRFLPISFISSPFPPEKFLFNFLRRALLGKRFLVSWEFVSPDRVILSVFTNVLSPLNIQGFPLGVLVEIFFNYTLFKSCFINKLKYTLKKIGKYLKSKNGFPLNKSNDKSHSFGN